MIISCIAVDDEPPALKLLTMYIGQTPFLSLKGQFDNGVEALKYVTENKVDLIFLDVQMTDLTGIELATILNRRNTQTATKIIFTTAFDQFAIAGYRLNILDYLLKPYTYEDFIRASKKALLLKSDVAVSTASASNTYIYLKVDFQIVKISCDEIVFIEGMKDYAKIYLNDKEKPILSLVTLRSLEEKLPYGKFLRIHKSFIVATDKITAITKNTLIIGEKTFTVSDAYKESFMEIFNNWI